MLLRRGDDDIDLVRKWDKTDFYNADMQYVACCIVCMHAQEPSFIARIFQYWKQALPEVKNGPAEEKRKFTNQKTRGGQLFLCAQKR